MIIMHCHGLHNIELLDYNINVLPRAITDSCNKIVLIYGIRVLICVGSIGV